MLSDGSNHRRILKPHVNIKEIWVGDVGGDDRLGGNCVVRNDRLVPQECSFGLQAPSPLSGSSISRPPDPSLACSRALRSITTSSREAALRACCALLSFNLQFIFVFIIIAICVHNYTHMRIPVPYLLKRVINVQRSAGYLRDLRNQRRMRMRSRQLYYRCTNGKNAQLCVHTHTCKLILCVCV
jgi:hypothetical protein